MTNIDKHVKLVSNNLNDSKGTFNNLAPSRLVFEIVDTIPRVVIPLQAYGITGDTMVELLGYLASANTIIPEYTREKVELGDTHTLLLQNEVVRASIDILIERLERLNSKGTLTLSEQLSEASLYIHHRDLLVKDLNAEELEEQDKALIINTCLKSLFEYAFMIIPAVENFEGNYKSDRIAEFKRYSINKIAEVYELDISTVDEMLSKILV